MRRAYHFRFRECGEVEDIEFLLFPEWEIAFKCPEGAD